MGGTDTHTRTIRDDIRLLRSALQETREDLAEMHGVLRGWNERCKSHSDDMLEIKTNHRSDRDEMWKEISKIRTSIKPKTHAGAIISAAAVAIAALIGSITTLIVSAWRG